jgi:hypothetical protein
MKKYLLWLNNGDSYEDNEINLIGVFTDKQKAKQAMKEADKTIKAALEEYMSKRPYANPYYASFSVFRTNCTPRYTLNIETIKEDVLIP